MSDYRDFKTDTPKERAALDRAMKRAAKNLGFRRVQEITARRMLGKTVRLYANEDPAIKRDAERERVKSQKAKRKATKAARKGNRK